MMLSGVGTIGNYNNNNTGIGLLSSKDGAEEEFVDFYNDELRQLVDTLTGGKMAQEILEKYNVTLDISGVGAVGTLLNRYDIGCKNYVCISQQTLNRMEIDPKFKHKVLHAIEEFCSPEEQAKVNALYPPVKSAGMIVYPDGKIMYWLEGYPNECKGVDNEKKVLYNANISELQKEYCGLELDAIEDSIVFTMDDKVQRKLQKKREEKERKERREQKERMEEALEEYIRYCRELREYYNELSYQKRMVVSNGDMATSVSVKKPAVVSAAYEMIMMLGM